MNQLQNMMPKQPDYDKLLEPIADITASIEALLDGAFGNLMGDQREALKRIYTNAWGLHTLLLDIVTNIGIEEMSNRSYLPQKFEEYLSKIIANAQSLLDEMDGPLTEEQVISVEFIQVTGHLLKGYIDKLWLYSQLRNNFYTLSPEPTSLTTICDPMNWEVSENDVDLELLIPQNAPDIRVNPVLMRTAMTELIDNAVNTTAKGYIRVSFKNKTEMIEITVENTGHPILIEHHESIFEPFYQVNTHRLGLGIGLTIVHLIVQLHNGTISVKSDEKSNRFILQIPT